MIKKYFKKKLKKTIFWIKKYKKLDITLLIKILKKTIISLCKYNRIIYINKTLIMMK